MSTFSTNVVIKADTSNMLEIARRMKALEDEVVKAQKDLKECEVSDSDWQGKSKGVYDQLLGSCTAAVGQTLESVDALSNTLMSIVGIYKDNDGNMCHDNKVILSNLEKHSANKNWDV